MLSSLGTYAKQAIDLARKQVAALLNAAQPSEIVFTSGGSESLNYAIKGTAMLQRKPDGTLVRDQIIASSIEHPAVLETCKWLQRSFGFRLSLIKVTPQGVVDLAHLEQILEKDKTCLVTVMHANNETGVLQPISDIAKVVRRISPSCVFHTGPCRLVLLPAPPLTHFSSARRVTKCWQGTNQCSAYGC